MIDEARKAREARLDILRMLKPCQGIMQHPRHKLPVPIVVTPFGLPTVTKDEIRDLMKAFWDAHPPIPAEAIVNATKPSIPDDVKKLLIAALADPFRASMEYATNLGWSASKITREKTLAKDNHLIRVHRIPTGRRGGAIEGIEILMEGYKLLGLNGPRPVVKGSFEHRWWCHRIARHLSGKGFKPQFEKRLGKKAADVAVEDESGWAAWEVQLDCRSSLVEDMLSKDIAGFEWTTICVRTAKDLVQVREIIATMGLCERAEARLLAEFYARSGGKQCD